MRGRPKTKFLALTSEAARATRRSTIQPAPRTRTLRSTMLAHDSWRGDQRHREPIVPFAANRLNRCGAQSSFRGDHFIESPHTLHARIAAPRLDHLPFPNDI